MECVYDVKMSLISCLILRQLSIHVSIAWEGEGEREREKEGGREGECVRKRKGEGGMQERGNGEYEKNCKEAWKKNPG